jgi:hypothetical protein
LTWRNPPKTELEVENPKLKVETKNWRLRVNVAVILVENFIVGDFDRDFTSQNPQSFTWVNWQNKTSLLNKENQWLKHKGGSHERSGTRSDEYRRHVVAARWDLPIVAATNPDGKTAPGRAAEAAESPPVREPAVPACTPEILQSRSTVRDLGRTWQATTLAGRAVALG